MSDNNTGTAVDGLDSLSRLGDGLKGLDSLSQSFGRSLSSALAVGIVKGRQFEDVLRSLGQRLVEIGLKAAFSPVESALSNTFGQLLGGAAGSLGSFGAASLFGAGAPLDIRPVPFAQGGVIASPGLFPLGRGLGLAGERGAEAIMPLARGPDGRLGVATDAPAAAAVTVNIVTPDIASFRRSDVQVASALARAVARGQRGL